MKVEQFTVGPLLTNCYLVTCEITNESVLIDPGDVTLELMDKVKESTLKAILLTHGHFDHFGGVNSVKNETGAPILIHSLDAPMLTDTELNGSFMIGASLISYEASGFLSAGEDVIFGESKLKVILTPGHTKGGISFASDGEFIIAGDTLFKLSVGRWDLPGGDYTILMKTIKEVFYKLSDTTRVYPGHGETTTIGFEKKYNPFMENI